MKIKSFECPKSIRNLKKITTDAWTRVICPSVLYCRLWDPAIDS